MNRCEVWRIIHRIFTYLNEFALVSTLGWPNTILNFDKSILQFWQMCFTILHITHRIFTYLNEFVLVSTWRVGKCNFKSILQFWHIYLTIWYIEHSHIWMSYTFLSSYRLGGWVNTIINLFYNFDKYIIQCGT